MDDLIYTDAQHHDAGVVGAYELSMECGPNARNDFLLSCPLRNHPDIEPRSIVYIEDTEFGGIVDILGANTKEAGRHKVIYRGRTWHGVLAGKVICPNAGQSHYRISGEANAALLAIINRLGITDLFTASAHSSGIMLDHLVRNEYAYSAILAALRASGAKLKIAWDGTRVELSAEPIHDWSSTDELDTDRLGLDVEKSYRTVNHLVCLGTGEMESRVTVHFFADSNGNVSEKQSLFGIDEVARVYDYSNAEEDELREQGREKLEEYQNSDTCETDVADGYDYDIGDIVGAYDVETGLFVSAPVVLKAVTVDRHGARTSYEVGAAASDSGLIGGTGESQGGGRTYVAGANVTIVGNTINAAVGLQDLAEVEDAARAAQTAASNVSAAVGRAQETADAAVADITAAPPLEASRTGTDVALAHAKSGVVAGSYGPEKNSMPDFGDVVTIPPRVSFDQEGHVTKAEGRTLKIPSTVAAYSALGLVKPDGVTVKVSSDGTLSAEQGEAASFLAAHPPESIYWTESPTNPQEKYGGVWEPREWPYGFLWARAKDLGD